MLSRSAWPSSCCSSPASSSRATSAIGSSPRSPSTHATAGLAQVTGTTDDGWQLVTYRGRDRRGAAGLAAPRHVELRRTDSSAGGRPVSTRARSDAGLWFLDAATFDPATGPGVHTVPGVRRACPTAAGPATSPAVTWSSTSRTPTRTSCAGSCSRSSADRLTRTGPRTKPVRPGRPIAHNAPTWDTWTSPECATSCRTAGCCSTTCRSASARAPRSRWSAPTAPARRRCCGSSPAS